MPTSRRTRHFLVDMISKYKKADYVGEEKRTVDGDPDEVTDLLNFGPSQLEWAKVPEHKVIVCSVCLELVPVLDELVRKCLGVFDHLSCVCLPGWVGGLQQRSRDTRDGIVVRPTLTRREHGIVHTLLEIFAGLAILTEEDETCARAAKRFVSERISFR